MRLINHANLSFLITRRTGLALEVDALPFSSDKISMMTDPASRSRSQSLHSLHGSQQRTSPDNSAQRRVSIESFSDQKHSQDSSSPRRSSRHISGTMYFNFKRPNETKDNVQVDTGSKKYLREHVPSRAKDSLSGDKGKSGA